MSTEAGTRIQRALQQALVNAVMGNERIARELGLLVTDLQALHLLVLRPDVRTPTRLSQAAGLPTSTITRVLDRLEEAGYLRRTADGADRRRMRIELDSERVDAVVRRYAQYSEHLDSVNAEFSADELDVVARYLERSSGTFADS